MDKLRRKIVWSSGPDHDEVSITATMKTKAQIQDIREALQIICDTFPEDLDPETTGTTDER